MMQFHKNNMVDILHRWYIEFYVKIEARLNHPDNILDFDTIKVHQNIVTFL